MNSAFACVSGSRDGADQNQNILREPLKGISVSMYGKNLHSFSASCKRVLCGAEIVKEICSSSACHSYRTRKAL